METRRPAAVIPQTDGHIPLLATSLLMKTQGGNHSVARGDGSAHHRVRWKDALIHLMKPDPIRKTPSFSGLSWQWTDKGGII
jgi:hypothetical protein